MIESKSYSRNIINIAYSVHPAKTKKAYDLAVISLLLIVRDLPIRTNERSRSPDGEAGLLSWDTYGMQP